MTFSDADPAYVKTATDTTRRLARETTAIRYASAHCPIGVPTIEWRASDWFADRFAELPERLVEAVHDIDPTLDETTPTLVHGDPSRINIHLDPDGLLDWERALVGDPAFGLVDAAFPHTGQPDVADDEADELIAALHDGYRERAGELPVGLDRYRPLYQAVSSLLVPQAFDDWAPQADRPNDELAAEVRDEFESRLEAVSDALD